MARDESTSFEERPDAFEDQCTEAGLVVERVPFAEGSTLPTKPTILQPADLLRLGAFSLESERSEAVEQQLASQREVYEQASQHDLIEALLARDRHLMQTGREAADGRMTGRLLRELMRGLLQQADASELKQLGQATKGKAIEGILQALGAEPADARQLKLQGSTLGPMEDPEERWLKLQSGERVK